MGIELPLGLNHRGQACFADRAVRMGSVCHYAGADLRHAGILQCHQPPAGHQLVRARTLSHSYLQAAATERSSCDKTGPASWSCQQGMLCHQALKLMKEFARSAVLNLQNLAVKVSPPALFLELHDCTPVACGPVGVKLTASSVVMHRMRPGRQRSSTTSWSC